ncbi:MAG: DUF58 domain-containing protein [Planctomycetes bacterium]|nr:DUF58 domain-containing protein [Planctomycetota bacterium]
MSPKTPTSSRRRLTELLDGQFMARLDGLDIFSRKMLQGKLRGERRSKRRGDGIEFADHRPYVIGDDLRFVDWNIYGRLDQLFLKLFLQEQDLTLQVMVDVSASVSDGQPTKEMFLKRLAAAIAYVGVVNNNRVTISAFADGVVAQIANMRGRNYLHQMAEMLLGTDSAGPSDFEKACRQVAATRVGSGVMIVLSDFLFKAGYEGALRRLISEKYDLYVVQVLSPQELAPTFSGDLTLVDMEDDDRAEVTISSALLKYYKRNLAAYCNELKGFCTRRGAIYALTGSGEPVEALILNYMRRRGLLR